METVFDVGMFDGADTAYYLESGYRVVSVEANPVLVQRAEKTFAPAGEVGATDLRSCGDCGNLRTCFADAWRRGFRVELNIGHLGHQHANGLHYGARHHNATDTRRARGTLLYEGGYRERGSTGSLFHRKRGRGTSRLRSAETSRNW